MKTLKKSLLSRVREAFRLEPLEPRVLLSADPILTPVALAMVPPPNQTLTSAYDELLAQSSAVSITVPLVRSIVSAPAANGSTTTSSQSVYSAGMYAANAGLLSSTLTVASGEALSGAGNINLDLVNNAVVSQGQNAGTLQVAS